MKRHALTDQQWEQLAPLLPPAKPQTGRPNHDHRLILNGILWRLKTGAPWRDLPEHFGAWQTVYSRFRRWQLAGVWARILAALQAKADADGRLDWSLHFVDGSVIRAHQHAAGAKKGAVNKPSAGAVVASARRSTSAVSVVASPSSSS
jgi:transposase